MRECDRVCVVCVAMGVCLVNYHSASLYVNTRAIKVPFLFLDNLFQFVQ